MPCADRIARGARPVGFSLGVEHLLRDRRYRLTVDALTLEAAVIHARGNTGLPQRLIGYLCPSLTEHEVLVQGRTEAGLSPLPSTEFQSRPRAKPLGSHFAGGHQQVCMVIARIGAGPRPMDADIDRAAILVGELTRERAHEVRALRRAQLRGDEDEPFPGQAGITAQACMFRRVPKRGAVLGPGHVGPGGELSRKDDFFVCDVAAIRVVIHLARSLIADALARAVSSGSRDSSTLATRDMLGAEKIGGHRASASL